ncbi:hypothetical protein EMO92_09910 [Bifidobacterium reuteri]|uniref:Sugar ABC transporter substrate-binding protein n=1 Tax=Bifidobacterium reuteri TaxID=983706 RepID=A0A5J5E336_9BIFI|nr:MULTISPECIES: hypothetical protein [Bifidobacterium]KAA8823488.1 hypothetical protein EMO92_09910 [Bifidobacterium reuteri]TPF78163.1 hypothetical protein BW09_05960 [Bifidobacterium sp. UTCIF-1]TPF81122.1 hypothetical protein BW08_00350 [Bifidobacterium sp. UTCIF-24]TPF82127.1 hypothetical protein BW12_06575 [Bifidobacterium sp. UTCIF-3]TPF85250.1 hypothetical protein BW07_00835 [Bifidobacterium sp. UTCIF-36]
MRRRIMVVISCTALVLSLAACTPVNRAVGDTQDNPPAVAHDSIHTSDAEVGFVGSADTAADKLALDAMADDGISVYYASLDSGTADAAGTATSDTAADAGADGADADGADADGTDAADSDITARQAVADYVARAVDIIIVSGIAVTDANRDAWEQTLGNAREAGIAVALLNPVSVPDNELLYAATLTVNDRDANAERIGDAVLAVIRDEPHERSIAVTTM